MTVPIPSFDRYSLELRLAKPVSFPFEHGGVLRGLFSQALKRHDLPAGLLPFPCESGHVRFAAGDLYTIGITLVGDARRLSSDLGTAFERIGGAGTRYAPDGPTLPAPVLGGNFVLERLERLEPPDLDAHVRAVRGAARLTLRFLSPFRLERPAEAKRRGAGFLDRDCFPAAFFLDRLWRRVYFLTHGHYPDRDERHAHFP